MYSLDFRKHVLKIGSKENLSIRDLAKRFGIASRTIVNWKQRLIPHLKRNKRPIKIKDEDLLKDIREHPDAYQYERAKRLNVSETGIFRALKRLKITYKKNAQASKSRRRTAVCILSKN